MGPHDTPVRICISYAQSNEEDGVGEERVKGCALLHATEAPTGRTVFGRPLRRSTCMFRGSEYVQRPSRAEPLERQGSQRPEPVRIKADSEGDSSLSRVSPTACSGAESFSRAATQAFDSMSAGELRYASAPSMAARGASVCSAAGPSARCGGMHV